LWKLEKTLRVKEELEIEEWNTFQEEMRLEIKTLIQTQDLMA
jgi:hypothetical protein